MQQTRWLREPRPVRIPWIELRRFVWRRKDADFARVRIVYERNGVRHEVADAAADPVVPAERCTPPPLI